MDKKTISSETRNQVIEIIKNSVNGIEFTTRVKGENITETFELQDYVSAVNFLLSLEMDFENSQSILLESTGLTFHELINLMNDNALNLMGKSEQIETDPDLIEPEMINHGCKLLQNTLLERGASGVATNSEVTATIRIDRGTYYLESASDLYESMKSVIKTFNIEKIGDITLTEIDRKLDEIMYIQHQPSLEFVAESIVTQTSELPMPELDFEKIA